MFTNSLKYIGFILNLTGLHYSIICLLATPLHHPSFSLRLLFNLFDSTFSPPPPCPAPTTFPLLAGSPPTPYNAILNFSPFFPPDPLFTSLLPLFSHAPPPSPSPSLSLIYPSVPKFFTPNPTQRFSLSISYLSPVHPDLQH